MTEQHGFGKSPSIGYWASQEQYPMEDLLTCARGKEGECMTSAQVAVTVTLHGFGWPQQLKELGQ
jgi:hypothetical protein